MNNPMESLFELSFNFLFKHSFVVIINKINVMNTGQINSSPVIDIALNVSEEVYFLKCSTKHSC